MVERRDVMRRGKTRRKQLFDDIKTKRGYGKLNPKALSSLMGIDSS
jgi:hypothetical protein